MTLKAAKQNLVHRALAAVIAQIERHSVDPESDLQAAAQGFLEALERLKSARATPWPPKLGQTVWIVALDVPGRIVARDMAGHTFLVLPLDGMPADSRLQRHRGDLMPLAPVAGLPADFDLTQPMKVQ